MSWCNFWQIEIKARIMKTPLTVCSRDLFYFFLCCQTCCMCCTMMDCLSEQQNVSCSTPFLSKCNQWHFKNHLFLCLKYFLSKLSRYIVKLVKITPLHTLSSMLCSECSLKQSGIHTGNPWPPYKERTPLHPCYRGLVRLLHCKTLHIVIFTLLYKVLIF